MAYRIGRPGEGAHAGSYVLAEAGERVSWGAIIAGVFAALAVQIFLLLVGVAIGLVAPSAADEAAPFFLGFSGLASLFCGGFVAGRMAGVPLLPSAALHGALVWSFVTVLSFLMAMGGAASVAGGAARLISGIGETAASAAGGVAQLLPDDASAMIPDEIQQELQEATGDQNLSPQQIRQEAQEIFTNVIDEQDRNRIATIMRETARAVVANPQNAGQELSSAMDRLVGAGGVIGQEERDELVSQLAQRFNISEQQANAIVDRWSQSLEQASQEAQQMMEEARAELADLAEEAQEAAAGAATTAAIVLFIGLFGACAGALLGRPEDVLAAEVAEARAHDSDHGGR